MLRLVRHMAAPGAKYDIYRLLPSFINAFVISFRFNIAISRLTRFVFRQIFLTVFDAQLQSEGFCTGVRIERRGDSFYLVFASLQLTWDEFGEWTLSVGDEVRSTRNSTHAAVVHGMCGNNNGQPLGACSRLSVASRNKCPQ